MILQMIACYIVAFFVVVSIVWFYSEILEKKYNFWFIVLIYYILDTVNTIIFGDIAGNYSIKGYIHLVYSLMIVIVCYRDTISKKLFIYIENVLLQIFVEIFGETIYFSIYKGYDEMNLYSYHRAMATFLLTIFQVIVFYFFISIHKKFKFILIYKKQLMICTCILVQLLIVAEIWFLIIYRPLNVILNIYGIISIAADGFIIRMMSLMEVKQQTETMTKYLEQQSYIMMRHCENIAKKTKKLEKLKCDYQEKINEVYELLDTQHLQEKSSFLLKMNEINMDRMENLTMDDNKKYNVIENNVVYEVINNIDTQITEIEQDTLGIGQYGMGKIVFDINLDIPKDINIKALDLSTLLMNMLENGVEAVEKQIVVYDKKAGNVGEKDYHMESEKNLHHMYIKAYGTYDGEKLMISVKNSKSKNQKISKVNNKYVTSKTNQAAHGYGLQIIENIAKKYGGQMKVTYGEDWFCNEVILFLKDEVEVHFGKNDF